MVSTGVHRRSGTGRVPHVEIHARGMAVLTTQVNRGTAFTMAERDHLGLHGLLPAALETLEQQVARSYEQFKATESDVEKWTFLTTSTRRTRRCSTASSVSTSTRCCRIVKISTVGAAIEEFSHLFRCCAACS